MRVTPIVLKIRSSNTVFKQNIGGAVELEIVRASQGIKENMAFVIPTKDSAERSRSEGSIDQTVTEQFTVVAVFKNDTSQRDKVGFSVNDLIHTARSQLFRALVGKFYYEGTSQIEYVGGQLLPLNPAYVWYQFDFQFETRLMQEVDYSDIQGNDLDDYGELRDDTQESQLPFLQRIYTNYILSPDERLSENLDLPLSDGFPDVLIPNISQLIDETDDPSRGSFAHGYTSGFNLFNISKLSCINFSSKSKHFSDKTSFTTWA